VRRQALESPARLQITIESILVQDSEPVGADLDGGRALLSLRAGAYFNFNPVASEIWQMLAEPRRVGEILTALRDGHDVDAETVARDVTPFLQTLVDHRLVRMIDPRQKR
jgi:Coenzyme PQQ synthesis protein D (PqqD)